MGREKKFTSEIKLKAVQEYLLHSRSAVSICKELGINDSSLRNWLRKYESHGAEGLCRMPKNKHYHESIKLQAVADYTNGKGSLYQICMLYNISTDGILLDWIKKYNNHETFKSHNSGGDRIMIKGRNTTFEERVKIVAFCIENNDNYQMTAEKFQVSYQQVYSWIQKYKAQGYESLSDRRGKHKKPEELSESEKYAIKVKLLEAENKRLIMENDFLKKLEEIERRR